MVVREVEEGKRQKSCRFPEIGTMLTQEMITAGLSRVVWGAATGRRRAEGIAVWRLGAVCAAPGWEDSVVDL